MRLEENVKCCGCGKVLPWDKAKYLHRRYWCTVVCFNDNIKRIEEHNTHDIA